MLLVAGLLASTAGHWWATRAERLLRIGQPDSWFQGGWAMVLGDLGVLSFGLPFAALLVTLPAARTGLTPGEAVCGAHPRRGWPSGLLVGGWALACCGLALAWLPLGATGLALGLGGALLRPTLSGRP